MQKFVQFMRRKKLPEALEILLFGTSGEVSERPSGFHPACPADGSSGLEPLQEIHPVPVRPVPIEEKDYRKAGEILEDWYASQEHCCEEGDMSMLSCRTGIDYELLKSYFNDHLHVSFRTWKLERRLDTAERLLLERETLRIDEVADLTGFSNHSNFYRRFKAYAGCTPLQWRSCRGNLNLL